MKNILIGVAIILALALMIGGVFLTSYNGVIGLEEQIYTSRAHITTQEKKRADLIPNLVDAAEAYAKHEKDTFTEVTKARAALMAGEHDQALALLNAVAEAYPQLASYDGYKEVMTALSVLENDISNSRISYNNAVRNYNRKVRSFPTSAVITSMGYDMVNFEYLNFEGYENPPTDLFK